MSLHDFKVNSITGKEVDLSQFKGKKIMVVNTASECGLTPQYAQLEELYKKHKDQCEIIGFPCNDFGAQEPGSASEIQSFCSKNYGVTFPMMEKIKVKGNEKHPLYDWLLKESSQKNQLGEVKWNFQKFLIDENGQHVKTIEPTVEPTDSEILNWINE
jgi:glutathione peroxidase